MSNQHTANHNDALTMVGALQRNGEYESVIQYRNRIIDDTVIVPIPWKAVHRANVRHLVRRSNG
ncbi:hypothetical protein GCM10010885_23330 [Alicyclobacillus cellulosilyticus]|uniref:Uncharacterized protein n=1 Tax=Alicyclobacillus cellulosilyticus TaxID=1003997 RepID=A0A917KI72_9BACL|nr:hypothetical protein [Alicyclobacillus cellulosilyticus]GGJ13387.1 hypothetical protein GCM10010885_23330 [Alicyclobacillus cellulosilyticus]